MECNRCGKTIGMEPTRFGALPYPNKGDEYGRWRWCVHLVLPTPMYGSYCPFGEAGEDCVDCTKFRDVRANSGTRKE